MGSIRQSMQAQPKNIKKYRSTKSTNRNKKISNKSMFSPSKVKRRQPKMLKKLSKHQIKQSEQKFSQKNFD
jgi:hypothetical protein